MYYQDIKKYIDIHQGAAAGYSGKESILRVSKRKPAPEKEQGIRPYQSDVV